MKSCDLSAVTSEKAVTTSAPAFDLVAMQWSRSDSDF